MILVLWKLVCVTLAPLKEYFSCLDSEVFLSRVEVAVFLMVVNQIIKNAKEWKMNQIKENNRFLRTNNGGESSLPPFVCLTSELIKFRKSIYVANGIDHGSGIVLSYNLNVRI